MNLQANLKSKQTNSYAEEEPDSKTRKWLFVGKSKWIESETSDKLFKFGKPNLSLNLIDESDSSALTIWILEHDFSRYSYDASSKQTFIQIVKKIEHKFGIDDHQKNFLWAFVYESVDEKILS